MLYILLRQFPFKTHLYQKCHIFTDNTVYLKNTYLQLEIMLAIIITVKYIMLP